MALAHRSLVLIAACALSLLPVARRPVLAEEPGKPDAQSPARPPIFEFVYKGDVAGVRAALAADPTQANVVSKGMTPLGSALGQKSLLVVQALLQGGADPNKPFGEEQWPPLHRAVTFGTSDAVIVLLANGADPNGKDVNGGTALHTAALKGLIEIARLLVDKGADVNAPFTAGGNLGATPLHFAVRSTSLPLVMALAARQPNWNLKWRDLTPVDIAEMNKLTDIAAYIRSKQATGGAAPVVAQQETKPDEGSSARPPIFEFVYKEDPAGVRAAMAADPTQANVVWKGVTPLGSAVGRKSLEVVQALLDGGADPNKPFGEEQWVPLRRAVTFGTSDAVIALLAKGADPNGKDINGGTALHAAAKDGLIEIAKLLLDKGADVNTPFTAGGNLGATPLHFAVRSNSLPLVMALAAHQPNWNLKWRDLTPVDVADMNKLTDIAAYIRSQQGTGGSAPLRAQQEAKPDAKSSAHPPIFDSVFKGDVAGVKAALAADPTQANLVGPGRMTPLGLALGKKNLDVVQALLEGGADPNKPFGPPQMVPLQFAAASGSVDAVKALLARGADPKTKDVNGGTALHVAARTGLIEIAELLIDKGVDVNAAFTAGPNAGATPLHIAAESKNVAMVMALCAHQPNWNLKWNGRTAAEVADGVGAETIATYIRARQGADGSTPVRAQHEVEAGSETNLLPAIFRLVSSGDVAGAKAALIADPSQANLEGPKKMTPLSLALGDKSSEMLQALLQGGADPNKPIDAIHTPPLQLAVVKGNADAVTALLANGADPNGKADNGFTALHMAVGTGLTTIAKLLVDKGADVNAFGQELMTPLGLALSAKKVEMVQALLQAGADPNKPIGASHTPPIGFAVLAETPDAIKALLAKGADPNGKADGGITALHAVVKTGSIETANLLLDKGADVNAPMTGDGAGLTPLFMAVASKNLAMVMAFATHQPNWKLKWNDGTPLELAERAGSTDIAAYIRRQMQDGGD